MPAQGNEQRSRRFVRSQEIKEKLSTSEFLAIVVDDSQYLGGQKTIGDGLVTSEVSRLGLKSLRDLINHLRRNIHTGILYRSNFVELGEIAIYEIIAELELLYRLVLKQPESFALPSTDKLLDKHRIGKSNIVTASPLLPAVAMEMEVRDKLKKKRFELAYEALKLARKDAQKILDQRRLRTDSIKKKQNELKREFRRDTHKQDLKINEFNDWSVLSMVEQRVRSRWHALKELNRQQFETRRERKVVVEPRTVFMTVDDWRRLQKQRQQLLVTGEIEAPRFFFSRNDNYQTLPPRRNDWYSSMANEIRKQLLLQHYNQ